MKEYKEGEHAFWNGKSPLDNPYIYGTSQDFNLWHMGFLYAKSVSLMREEEVNA